MRSQTLFFLLLLSQVQANCQYHYVSEDNSENSPELIRSLRIRKEVVYLFQRLPNAKDSIPDSIIDYDTLGHIVRVGKYTEGKGETGIDTFLYNDKNQLTIEYHFKAGKDYDVTEYGYDSIHRAVFQINYPKDTSSMMVYKQEFDPDGKMITEYKQKNNEPMYRHRSIIYDVNGRLINEQYFEKTGSMLYSIKYEYGTDGFTSRQYKIDNTGKNLREELEYNANHRVVSRYVYALQINSGNNISFKTYSKDEKYIYNADGTLHQFTNISGYGTKLMWRHYYLYR